MSPVAGRWRRVSGILSGALLVTALVLASTVTYLTFLDRPSSPQSIGTIMIQLEYGPEVGTAPLTVSFHVNVTGGESPYSYSWRFGDSTNSTSGPNVNHTYSSQGTYGAMVTVTCLAGRLETESRQLLVFVN